MEENRGVPGFGIEVIYSYEVICKLVVSLYSIKAISKRLKNT